MSSKTAIIIRREYMERVTKKSFIITTILMPILMLALMVTPVLVAELAGTDQRSMTVIDNSGMIALHLQATDEYTIDTLASGTDWPE